MTQARVAAGIRIVLRARLDHVLYGVVSIQARSSHLVK